MRTNTRTLSSLIPAVVVLLSPVPPPPPTYTPHYDNKHFFFQVLLRGYRGRARRIYNIPRSGRTPPTRFFVSFFFFLFFFPPRHTRLSITILSRSVTRKHGTFFFFYFSKTNTKRVLNKTVVVVHVRYKSEIRFIRNENQKKKNRHLSRRIIRARKKKPKTLSIIVAGPCDTPTLH